MSNEKEIKQKLIDGLSSESMESAPLKELMDSEPENVLGSDFTRSVMQKVKAVKKPSPIVRITRVALPVAACAAAIAIFVTVGMRGNDDILFPEGINTVYSSGDDMIQDNEPPTYAMNDPDEDRSLSEEYDTVPDTDEEADASAEISKPHSAPPDTTSTAAGSESTKANYGYNLSVEDYNTGISVAQNEITAFSASDDALFEVGEGKIILKISEPYYERSVFGQEIYLSSDGTEYEVIITSDKEISKTELLNQIKDYISTLDSEMNSADDTPDWQIEILSETLPEVIEPQTHIKVIRTK